MIRYYAYYSCGGYKDLYLGNSSDTVEYTFFLPLFPIWRSGAKPEYADKLKQAEDLQQIEVVSKDNNFGFPTQAKNLFSHGGYRVIYLTLSNGNTCFCVRDIINGTKDEESRDIPFNILITASGEDDIKRLDAYALYSLSHIKELYDSLAPLFSYDYKVNGIRFNIAQISRALNDVPLSAKEIEHDPDHVILLIVDSLSMVQTVYNELDLSRELVDLISDGNGKCMGTIKYKVALPPKVEHELKEEVSDSTSTDNGLEPQLPDDTEFRNLKDTSLSKTDESEDVITESPNAAENSDTSKNYNKSQILLLELKETLSQNSSLLKEIHGCISDTKSEIMERSERIMKQINQIMNNQDNHQNLVKSDDDRDYNSITISKVYLWIAGIALVVGLLLGGLIF